MTAARPVPKIDDPPAVAPEPAPPRKARAPVRIEGAWVRKRAELAAIEKGDIGGAGDGEDGPPAPPAQGPPQAGSGGPPASAAAPIPAAALPPSTAAFDAAWAKLMVRPVPRQPDPPAVWTPAATRPGGGPSAFELAQAVAGGGDVRPLVDHLAARWKDRKPETLNFWRSGLAELSTGLVTPELVAGLAADADRRGVERRSHQFSKALGTELSAARRAKNRPPGLPQNSPGGQPRSSSSP